MKEFIQQVAQDTAIKVDTAIAGAAVTSWWWMPHFDTIVHILLGLGAVGLVFSRFAIVWLKYRNETRANR